MWALPHPERPSDLYGSLSTLLGITAATAIVDALSRAERPVAIIGDEARWEMRSGLDPARLRTALERHRLPFSPTVPEIAVTSPLDVFLILF